MGLTFQTEQERNPSTKHTEPVVDTNLDLQAQLDEVNQFIDENNLLKRFYMWQELKRQMYDTSAEVIDEGLTLNDVASLEDEV